MWGHRPHLGALLALAIAAVAQEAANSSAAENPYVVAADRQAVEDAQAAADASCPAEGAFTDAERAEGRSALAAHLGSDDVVRKILVAANSTEDVIATAQLHITADWVIAKAVPLILSFVLCAICCVCCWTACPFCRCCRCCGRRKDCHPAVRAIVPFTVFGFFFGICFSASLVNAGYVSARKGFERSSCHTATLLNTTLAGQGGAAPFIGMIGALEAFWELAETLQNGSSFVTGMETALDASAPIASATQVAGGTLSLFAAMMEAPANVRPTSAIGKDLLHDCTFCTGVAPTVRQAREAFNSGVGVALANARAEVEDKLSPAAREDLTRVLLHSTPPLVGFKEIMRMLLSFFVDTEKMGQVRQAMHTYVYYAGVILLVWAFLITFFALVSGAWYAVRDKVEEDPLQAVPANPYYSAVHRCACCAWFCSFCFIIVALMFGGLLTVAGNPLSGTCLILDGLHDRALAEDVGPALGMTQLGENEDLAEHVGQDAVEMLLDMMSQCLATRNGTSNANLLDVLYTRNSSVAEKDYLRASIVGQATVPIGNQFSALTSARGASASNLQLGNNPDVVKLREICRLEDVSAWLVASDDMRNDPEFQSLTLDDRGTDGLAVGFNTSARCEDQTVQANLSGLQGRSIPGITNFSAKLERYGVLEVTSTCARSVVCASTAAPDSDICAAGNRYIDYKKEVRGASTYRCDLFEDPTGQAAYCDPAAMAQTGGDAGPWLGDCLFPDGTMRTKNRTCDLQTFSTYVQEFNLRIKKVMSRLDLAVDSAMDKVDTDLRQLLDQHVVSVVDNVAAGGTCGSLAPDYRGMVDAFCFEGVGGLVKIGNGFVVLGFEMLALTLTMYITWRLAIDNFNEWEKEHTGCKRSSVVPVPDP